MKQPKRILHVFSALDQGGIENMVMNLYRNIDTDKIQFDFALSEGRKSFFDDEVLKRGGRIFYFKKYSSNKLIDFYQNLSFIFRQYGSFRAVHSHCYFFTGYILLLAKFYGIKIRVAHAHDTYKGQVYSVYRKIYENIFRKLIIMNATHLLACSLEAGAYVFGCRGVLNDNFKVFPNAIDTKKFAYNKMIRKKMRKELKVEKNFVIGHVGRFVPQKNHSFIIDIFQEIYTMDNAVKLMFIGGGDKEIEIKEKVNKLHLENAVLFLGNRDDVSDLLQTMDVFLFPSLYEGLGIVLIEAQVSGLPCIVSDVIPKEVGITDLIEFTSLNKPNKYWIEKLINYKSERIDRSNEVIEAGYDIKDISIYLENLYLMII